MNTSNRDIDKVQQLSFESIVFSDRQAGVTCPHCRIELVIATLDEVKIAACQKCQGMLIQAESLSHMVREKRAGYQIEGVTPKPLNQNQLKVKRDCPSCLTRFDTHPYYGPGNVVIDSCMGCRLIWLDQGELTSVVKAPGQR